MRPRSAASKHVIPRAKEDEVEDLPEFLKFHEEAVGRHQERIGASPRRETSRAEREPSFEDKLNEICLEKKNCTVSEPKQSSSGSEPSDDGSSPSMLSVILEETAENLRSMLSKRGRESADDLERARTCEKHEHESS